MPRGHRILVNPKQNTTQQKGKCYIQGWASWGSDSAERPHCCSNHNLFPTPKEGNGIFKKHENQEPYHILSHSYYFPVLVSHAHWKWWHRRKEKDRATHRPFSFQFFLTLQWAEGRALVQCATSRSKIKTVELVLCSFSSVLVKMKCTPMSCKNNCVISVIPCIWVNALLFKTGIKN